MADTPVLDTLAAMTAESIARSTLDDNSLIAARLAALAAVDAPALSYLARTSARPWTPVSRSSRSRASSSRSRRSSARRRPMSAAGRITEALGIVIIAAEAELEAEEEAG